MNDLCLQVLAELPGGALIQRAMLAAQLTNLTELASVSGLSAGQLLAVLRGESKVNAEWRAVEKVLGIPLKGVVKRQGMARARRGQAHGYV